MAGGGRSRGQSRRVIGEGAPGRGKIEVLADRAAYGGAARPMSGDQQAQRMYAVQAIDEDDATQ